MPEVVLQPATLDSALKKGVSLKSPVQRDNVVSIPVFCFWNMNQQGTQGSKGFFSSKNGKAEVMLYVSF